MEPTGGEIGVEAEESLTENAQGPRDDLEMQSVDPLVMDAGYSGLR